jgi:hypothetical protein
MMMSAAQKANRLASLSTELGRELHSRIWCFIGRSS